MARRAATLAADGAILTTCRGVKPPRMHALADRQIALPAKGIGRRIKASASGGAIFCDRVRKAVVLFHGTAPLSLGEMSPYFWAKTF